MQRLALLLALALLAPAGGCGFHPLYGGVSGEIRALELSQVTVTPIETRTGAILRNSLIDRLTPAGEPAFPQYRLDINLSEAREGLAIQADASVTRWNYELTANYELFDLGSGEVVHRGVARSVVAYSVVQSQFATLTAEQNAKRSAAQDLASQIDLRLAVFFERR